jgi:hypothetical protein
MANFKEINMNIIDTLSKQDWMEIWLYLEDNEDGPHIVFDDYQSELLNTWYKDLPDYPD